MWVFIVLLTIAFTIITVRLFRNGAREAAIERETAPGLATPARPGTQPVTTSPQAPPAPVAAAVVSGEQRAEPEGVSPYPPAAAEQAGTPCASCGTPTVPGAKFCGECGTRLAS
jgi:hypothetical protein